MQPQPAINTNYVFTPPPKQYEAHNDNICVEPFPEEEGKVDLKVNKGFGIARQKVTLKGLKVLIGNEKYPEGSVVFVNGDQYVAQWAQRIFEVDGKKFILCPVKAIEFVRYFQVGAWTLGTLTTTPVTDAVTTKP